jgi:phage shock protein A
MSGLFDKLNTLLKAGVNSVLGNLTGGQDAPSGETTVPASLKDADRQIVALRKQINKALEQEDSMQVALDRLLQEVAGLDQQADEALQTGDEDRARQLVRKMQERRRAASLKKVELDQHREVTAQFIEKVNMLEAMVSDARRQQGDLHSDEVPSQAEQPDLMEKGREAGAALTDVLKNMRERAEQVLTPIVTQAETLLRGESGSTPDFPATSSTAPASDVKVTVSPPPPKSDDLKKAEEKAIEEDLKRRRSRLSNPGEQ